MTCNEAITEISQFRDFLVAKPPSRKGTLMFEAIQAVLREIEQLREENELLRRHCTTHQEAMVEIELARKAEQAKGE